MFNIDDVREFDRFLLQRIERFRQKLRDWLAPHRLVLAEARVHKVLIPMVGVYTPGWQALPACSWGYVELITTSGMVGTGEWSIDLPPEIGRAIAELQDRHGHNLLDTKWEQPLCMAWWDLVGQVLGRPLHCLWAELFERDGEPPDRVPMAAYTWQRFSDLKGANEVTFDNWPAHARERVNEGFRAIKMSISAYQPEDHIELIHNVRAAIGPDVALRIDPHGTWNLTEARRILRAIERCNIEFAEQPINALIPQRYYSKDTLTSRRSFAAGGYQLEYYFRHMTHLRREQTIPLSCHWWTPPIVQPVDGLVSENHWTPNWYLMERYDAADISAPDIGLGPWGLWRICELSRFMGMQRTIHSNFELGLQLSYRSALAAAVMYDTESAGLYMGTTPRACHAIDNETIQVSDDVLQGGPLKYDGGGLCLSNSPGHGCRLDPERLRCYRYTEEAVAPYRAQARKIYSNYLLDRPRRTTQSGWGKDPGAERFHRHSYPYELASVLDGEATQDVDIELNR